MPRGPRSRQPRPPVGPQMPMNLVEAQVSFDKEAFLHAIHSHGVTVEHYRAIPDPRGMASKGDSHAVMLRHVRSNSDGFIYEKVGTFRSLFINNQQQYSQLQEGALAFATAYMTLPEFYEDNPKEAILVAPYDRFYIKDIEARVVHRQYVEANSSGIDKLQYPATHVEHLIDANGVVYQQGQEFILTEEGHIKWISQKRPGWNPQLNRGTVYAVRFRYTPFFVCARIIHEIRIANITDKVTFQRKVERMPYQIQVVRENVFYDTNIDPLKPIPPDERFSSAPVPSGLLGPDPGGNFGRSDEP